MTSSTSTRLSRVVRGIGAAIAASIAVVGITATPAAADTYRYWSYWNAADGAWSMAMTGGADRILNDGDVDGWRFGAFGLETTITPRTDADLVTLCPVLAAEEAAEGEIRVAVVVDPGTASVAPEGETPGDVIVSCLTLPAGTNGNQALEAAAEVRFDGGLICGVNGYPAGECGPKVDDALGSTEAQSEPAATVEVRDGTPAVLDAPQESTADETGGGVDLTTLLAIAAVALGVILIVMRRRNQANS